MMTSLPFDERTATNEPLVCELLQPEVVSASAVRLPDAQLTDDAAMVGQAHGMRLWQRDGEWCDQLGPWNPLECDDDALELAFMCGMSLHCQPLVNVTWRGQTQLATSGVPDDRTRGLRYAIVRMAAGAVQEMTR